MIAGSGRAPITDARSNGKVTLSELGPILPFEMQSNSILVASLMVIVPTPSTPLIPLV
jgi:hypothetical protein